MKQIIVWSAIAVVVMCIGIGATVGLNELENAADTTPSEVTRKQLTVGGWTFSCRILRQNGKLFAFVNNTKDAFGEQEEIGEVRKFGMWKPSIVEDRANNRILFLVGNTTIAYDVKSQSWQKQNDRGSH